MGLCDAGLFVLHRASTIPGSHLLITNSRNDCPTSLFQNASQWAVPPPPPPGLDHTALESYGPGLKSKLSLGCVSLGMFLNLSEPLAFFFCKMTVAVSHRGDLGVWVSNLW